MPSSTILLLETNADAASAVERPLVGIGYQVTTTADPNAAAALRTAIAGERLVVEIAGHPVGPPAALDLPGGILDMPTRNRGTHRIRTGGTYDSHLLLPVIR